MARALVSGLLASAQGRGESNTEQGRNGPTSQSYGGETACVLGSAQSDGGGIVPILGVSQSAGGNCFHRNWGQDRHRTRQRVDSKERPSALRTE